MVVHSQLAPLPSEVPFRIVSKTIGQGAYACIKKAVPLNSSTPVFAVKFIHKAYAVRHGRITPKQLTLEVTLHQHVGFHSNIIQFFNSGEDHTWRWVAMELAEGGDLFDKIESDVGVGEDIAHLYFTQLISAVAFMHSKGVGHRDLKPENILLSAEGNMKIADFGLSTYFSHNGLRKISKTSCGSPPYTAPEVLSCDFGMARKAGPSYYGDLVDIWSCGVVLFVLLVGNTPWDEPLERSYEFHEYVKTNQRPDDDLWRNLPTETLSLLRGILRVDPELRFSLEDIRRHPWFTRKNQYLGADGQLVNPVALATQMFESMRIDFDQAPATVPDSQRSEDSMQIDSQDILPKHSLTQPETPVADIMFDWEKPLRVGARLGFSASQPVRSEAAMHGRSNSWADRLADEPSFSQFSATPSVPFSRTQHARQFRDIIPSNSLTRFFSLLSFPAVISTILGSLHRLGVPAPALPQSALDGRDRAAWVKVRTNDSRNCPMNGDIVVEKMEGIDERMLEVNFIKVKGDPVEWRRFFKKIVVLCKDTVYRPDD